MIFIICDNNVLIIYIYIAYRDMYIIIYIILGTPISYYICIYIYNNNIYKYIISNLFIYIYIMGHTYSTSYCINTFQDEDLIDTAGAAVQHCPA